MKLSVTKQFRFDAAHRLLNYKGLCANLHGHTYVAEVTLTLERGVLSPEKLDNGMLLDFGDLKEKIGGWIDDNWDHAVLIHPEDEFATLKGADITRYWICSFGNPTAENMARELLQIVQQSYSKYDHLRVRIYETPTSWAEVET